MISTISRHLGLIDGTSADWIGETRQQIESGCNFLLILLNTPTAIEDFCKVFEMAPDCDPTPMPRYSLFSMSQYIDEKAFDELLHAQNDGKRILFIDQLDLALNKPPRVKPYLVYCPIWGIISQHDELRGARDSLDDYSFTFYRFRRNPEAAIYRWINGKWELLEIPQAKLPISAAALCATLTKPSEGSAIWITQNERQNNEKHENHSAELDCVHRLRTGGLRLAHT